MSAGEPETEAGAADYAVAAKEIGSLLGELADRNTEEQAMDPDGRLELENQIAMGMRFAPSIGVEELGPPIGYTCPNCNGALMAVGENAYRCQVGHAWTAEALLLAYDDELEETVWAAIRILKEKVTLSRKLAENARGAADLKRYTASADQAEHAIAVLHRGLFTPNTTGSGDDERGGNGQ